MSATNAQKNQQTSDTASGRQTGKNSLPNSNAIRVAPTKRTALGDIRLASESGGSSADNKNEPSAKAPGKKSSSGSATVGAPAKAQSRKRVRTADKENAGPEGPAGAKRSKVGRASVKVSKGTKEAPAAAARASLSIAGPPVGVTYADDAHTTTATVSATASVADEPTRERVIHSTSSQGPPAAVAEVGDQSDDDEEEDAVGNALSDSEKAFRFTLATLEVDHQNILIEELGCDPHGLLKRNEEDIPNADEPLTSFRPVIDN